MVVFWGRESRGRYSGTGIMRAVQISQTNANWSHNNHDNLAKADILVLVKRGFPPFTISFKGKHVVIDPLDYWPQGLGYHLSSSTVQEAYDLFTSYLSRIPWKPTSFIFANKKMADDLGPRTGLPYAHIYHHFHPKIAINPIREIAKNVVFEGSSKWLGEWADILPRLCKKVGLNFIFNPTKYGQGLAEGDIAIAFRSKFFDTYMMRHYKSNIKLANIYGSGTPCILPSETSYKELATENVMFADTEEQILEALDALKPYEVRKKIHYEFLEASKPFNIQNISIEYKKFFQVIGSLK